MKPLLWSVLMIFVGTSCTKTASVPAAPEIQSQLITPKTDADPVRLTATVAGATLEITLQPRVTCYSYRMGETPQPCAITVVMTGTLSKPLDGYLDIELEKNNVLSAQKPGDPINNSDLDEGARFVTLLPPNVTTFSVDTGIPTFSNNYVPDGQFKLKSVTLVKMVN